MWTSVDDRDERDKRNLRLVSVLTGAQLFPKKLQDAFDLAMRSIGEASKSGDWSIADKQYEAMYSEIRKMLGFEE